MISSSFIDFLLGAKNKSAFHDLLCLLNEEKLFYLKIYKIIEHTASDVFNLGCILKL